MANDASPNLDPKTDFLRHAVATTAYRGAKAVRGAPADFAFFRAAESVRSPGEILAHIGDLFDWALSMARGKQEWHDSKPLPWNEEVARFHRTLEAFDSYLASGAALATPAEKLFQGPVADALTHIGQLAILRRISGFPIRGENYSKAEIVSGRTGPDQSAPSREF
jgi:hypothetical protein